VEITVLFAARVIEAVRRVAAEEIVPRYRSVVALRKDDGSVVTEADMAAQAALVRALTAIEPLPVLAEEMASEEQHGVFDRAQRFWCVDPLDGTKNFSEGVPFFSVSVALMEGSRPAFGVVYDPIADEAYYAVRGAGAWLNHRPLELPSTGPALEGAVAVHGAGSLDDAVVRAHELARPGGVVLLAPACASFDMFRDYAERGRRFKEEVARVGER